MNDFDDDLVLLPSIDVKGSMKDFLASIDGTIENYYGREKRVAVEERVKEPQPLTPNQIRWRKQRINRIPRRQGYNPVKLKGGERNGSYSPDPNGSTKHAPGTEAKLLVLQDRAKRGVALFHPDDCSLDCSLMDSCRY